MVVTDDLKGYRTVRREFNHQCVNHSAGQYVNGQVHTNTIEGYFSLLKRGINGVFHHVSNKHLHRYLCEFDFRYNMRESTNGTRTATALGFIEGKSLMYRQPASPEQVA